MKVDGLVYWGNTHKSAFSGLNSLTFQVENFALLLGGKFKLVVLLQTVKEILTAGRMRHVLNSDVDFLGDDPGADTLVHDDTDGVLGHVVDSTSFTVVELVGHTLVERTVALNVDNISTLVHFEEGGQFLHAMVAKFAGEKVASTTAITLGIGHGCCGQKKKDSLGQNEPKTKEY